MWWYSTTALATRNRGGNTNWPKLIFLVGRVLALRSLIMTAVVETHGQGVTWRWLVATVVMAAVALLAYNFVQSILSPGGNG